MKKIYLILKLSLIANLIFGQNMAFVQVSREQNYPYNTTGLNKGNYVSFVDIDNDNDQDIFITNYEDGILYINDGNGNFTFFSNPFNFDSHSAFAFADVDNDNDQDIIITGIINSEYVTKLFMNDGTGVFSENFETSFDGRINGTVKFVDVDNDNDNDVIISGIKESGLRYSSLYINDGTGFFGIRETPFIGVYNSSIACTDVDNDGDQDVLITGDGDHQAKTELYLNDGNGNFIESSVYLYSVEKSSADFADIDNDGDQDLLIVGKYETFSTPELYINNGLGEFSPVQEYPFLHTYCTDIAFKDIDNDGDQDVLILSQNVNLTKLYTNDGNGNFTQFQTNCFDGDDGNNSLSFADIDNDNDQDLIIVGGYATKLYKWKSIIGIAEHSKNNRIIIFPNPTNGNIYVKGGNINNIDITNIKGQIIKHINVNNDNINIDLTNQSKGIYFIKIILDKKSVIKKVVIE